MILGSAVIKVQWLAMGMEPSPWQPGPRYVPTAPGWARPAQDDTHSPSPSKEFWAQSHEATAPRELPGFTAQGPGPSQLPWGGAALAGGEVPVESTGGGDSKSSLPEGEEGTFREAPGCRSPEASLHALGPVCGSSREAALTSPHTVSCPLFQIEDICRHVSSREHR